MVGTGGTRPAYTCTWDTRFTTVRLKEPAGWLLCMLTLMAIAFICSLHQTNIHIQIKKLFYLCIIYTLTKLNLTTGGFGILYFIIEKRWCKSKVRNTSCTKIPHKKDNTECEVRMVLSYLFRPGRQHHVCKHIINQCKLKTYSHCT